MLPRLMAITPGTLTVGQPATTRALIATLQLLSGAGVGLFQFREKNIPCAEARAAFNSCVAATASDSVWLVNAHVAGGHELPAAGMHLPSNVALLDAPLHGRSVHHRDQLSAALAEGVDYVVASPVLSPSTKDVSGHGWSWLESICTAAGSCPVYALGGIGPEHVAACLDAGAHGVAALSGLMHASDPALAARRYLDAGLR